MKHCKINFRRLLLISVIILFIVCCMIACGRMTENHIISQWYDGVSAVVEHKDNIRHIQIIYNTPDGAETNDIEPEKYIDYLDFLQSVIVSADNTENLDGISKTLVVKYGDGKEFQALFMGNYINIGKRYYKIENYSQISDILHNL